MFFKLIMILGALFGFIYALRVKETYARVINWTMVIAIGATFLPVSEIVIDAYYLFALTQLGVIVYGFSGADFSSLKKTALISAGVLSLIPLAIILSMPSVAAESSDSIFMTRLAIFFIVSAIIQLSVLIYALKTDIQAYQAEMGFLIILFADATARLLSSISFFVLPNA